MPKRDSKEAKRNGFVTPVDRLPLLGLPAAAARSRLEPGRNRLRLRRQLNHQLPLLAAIQRQANRWSSVIGPLANPECALLSIAIPSNRRRGGLFIVNTLPHGAPDDDHAGGYLR